MATHYVTHTVDTADPDLIPIYYRVPFDTNGEIISGYLEKTRLPPGTEEKRFFGQFKCDNCSKGWNSGNTWQGYTQDCDNCKIKAWPYKVYHLEQSTDNSVGKPHRSDLCEKCRELGFNCHTGKSLHKSGYSSSPRKSRYDVCFNKQFELFKYDIIIEPKFIRNLYDTLWPSLSPSEEKEFIQGLKNAKRQWESKDNSDLVDACQDILDTISD